MGAACILPLSQQPLADRSLGTRHRAALGLSEETDALVFVVSEETSAISLAVGGHLHRSLTPDRIRQALAGRLPGDTSASPPVTRARLPTFPSGVPPGAPPPSSPWPSWPGMS